MDVNKTTETLMEEESDTLNFTDIINNFGDRVSGDTIQDPVSSSTIQDPESVLRQDGSTSDIVENLSDHIAHLQIELQNKERLVEQLKKQNKDIRQLREEEENEYRNSIAFMKRNFQDDFQNEMEKLEDEIRQQYQDEYNAMLLEKESVFQVQKNEWAVERKKLLLETQHLKQNSSKNSEGADMLEKLEKQIFVLEESNKKLQDELVYFQDFDRNQVEHNKMVYDKYLTEVSNLKKEALKDSKKQLMEIKQLHKIIEQLERKLGFEPGICIRLQSEKNDLDDALGKIKDFQTQDKQHNFFANMKENRELEADIEGFILDLPPRLASKSHNDPERIIHRRNLELSSLIRRLDEKNQVLAVKNEELREELGGIHEVHKPLEDKIVQLGNKNMELNKIVRKLESKIKDQQKDINEKEDKVMNLQELIERKDRKLKKSQKKEQPQINAEDYNDLQRQVCEQLQIMAELRQQNIEKDNYITMLKQKVLKSPLEGSRRKSLSLDSLTKSEDEFMELGNENIATEDGEALFGMSRHNFNENQNLKKLMAKLSKENLELQHAYALLQKHSCETKDPERTSLERETLQSDLLVLQATVSELENKLEDKDLEQDKFLEQTKMLEVKVEDLEENNEDLHQKLISAESDLVQKTLQLKGLTEEMKELMDQNELMEFKVAEIQATKFKPKSTNTLKLTEEDREDLTTDIEDVEWDAVSVRIALKELEINQQDMLSPFEKRTLVQARALVDKGDKELVTLKETECRLRTHLYDIEQKYMDTKLKLAAQEKELTHFRNEKLKNEEAVLLDVQNLTQTGGKKRKASFDLTFGFEKTPSEQLADAKSKIMELEYVNEILQSKINRIGGEFGLSDDEIELLRQKMDQLRDAEKQINILKVSNDDLLQRLTKFEGGNIGQSMKTTIDFMSLPEELAQEISKLKKENEELNGELGSLRLRADDALALARQTKEALCRDDRSTQTPSFELLDSLLAQRNQQSTTESLQIPDLDPKEIEKTVIEEMVEEFVLEDVECLPYEGNLTLDDEVSEDHQEELLVPDEEQLHSDNEFIQSILREYDQNVTPTSHSHNESVIYRPIEQSRPQTEEDGFTVYLNETLTFDTPRSSDPPLSHLSSISHADKRNAGSLGSTPRFDQQDEKENRWSTFNIGNESENLVDDHLSSGCSTCGLTPRNIPQDVFEELQNYQTVQSRDTSSNTTPRNDPEDKCHMRNALSYSHSISQASSRSASSSRRGSQVSDRRGSQSSESTFRADSYKSSCSTCGMTPPHTPRTTSDNQARDDTTTVYTRCELQPKLNQDSLLVHRPSRPVFIASPENESYNLTSQLLWKNRRAYEDIRTADSASPPYTICQAPPPYDDNEKENITKPNLFSNLPEISEDVLRAIDNSIEKNNSSADSSQEMENIDPDIKELLDYGKSIKEFEDYDDELYMSTDKKSQTIPKFERPRSYSVPELSRADYVSNLVTEKDDDVKEIESTYTSPLSSRMDSLIKQRHETSSNLSKYDMTDFRRIDSGIGSMPREEIDSTYGDRYACNFPYTPVGADTSNYFAVRPVDNAELKPLLTSRDKARSPYSNTRKECSCKSECEWRNDLPKPIVNEYVECVHDRMSRQQSRDYGQPIQEKKDVAISSNHRVMSPCILLTDDYQSCHGVPSQQEIRPVTHNFEKHQPGYIDREACVVTRESFRDLPATPAINNLNHFKYSSTGDPTPSYGDGRNRHFNLVSESDRCLPFRRSSQIPRGRQPKNTEDCQRNPSELPRRPSRPVEWKRRSYSSSPIRTRSFSPGPLSHFDRSCYDFKFLRNKYPSDSELSRKSDQTDCLQCLRERGRELSLTKTISSRKRKLPTERMDCIRDERPDVTSAYTCDLDDFCPTDCQPNINGPSNKHRRGRIQHLLDQIERGISRFGRKPHDIGNEEVMANEKFEAMEPDDSTSMLKNINFLREQCSSLERQLKNRDFVIHTMQDELRDESEHIVIIEKKDKVIQLKEESIAQITQILEKTKKELQTKIVESNRRESEIKQLKIEMKNILVEKKKVEHSYSEQQISIAKLVTTETRLEQMTAKCDELVSANRELVERIKTLEISEREFIDLERNVIELQTQLRDMEDVEVHRDELYQKLQQVKKQRDDFLQKGKIVEEERDEFVRSNKTLEQYIMEWRKKTTEFKKTNQALKDRILALERDKKELEERVLDVQQERTLLQTRLVKIEHERDDYIGELKEITFERNALEARLADYEDLLGDHDQLEEGFHSLRLKVAELTRQRDDLEMLIPSYKTKIQMMKKVLNEKEEIIIQLSHDIKTLRIATENSSFHELSTTKPHHHYHPRSSPAIKSYFLDREPNFDKYYRPSDIELTSESDSYDLIPVNPSKYDSYSDESITEYTRGRRHKIRGKKYVALFDYDPYKSSTSGHPERELRLKEGDYVTVHGDIDIDGYLEGEVDGVAGLVPSIYVEELTDDERHMSHGQHYHTSTNREQRFVVLYDYDPYTMGTTDRPDLQLSLRKGDVIIIIDDVDRDGYYTALLNGKRGLVPSNFVQEYSAYYQSRESHRQHSNHHQSNYDSNFEGTIVVDHVVGPPYAPRDLKVTRVVTQTAVILGWQLPPMDEYGNSNGCKVTGYRIWVNGKVKQVVKSGKTTKALVDDVDLHDRVEFSLQTIGENDICSEKCHFAITGALATLSDSHTMYGSGGYVALYDYDPFKSSPNPNPSLELEFHEGDILTVTDKTRSDGFYTAELNGKKGLVPSNFIERVSGGSSHAHSSSHHQHRITSHSSAHQDSDENRRVSFKSKEI